MSSKSVTPGPVITQSPKERGKRAFQASRFAEAIDHWGEIVEPNAALKSALAEAHFRQAVALQLDASGLSQMRDAVRLMPNDPIYAYWYAVALHKDGQLQEALTEYRRAEALGLTQAPGAAQRNPALSVWLAQRGTGQISAWPEPSAQPGDPHNTTPRMVYDAVVLLVRNDEEGTKKALARLSEMSPKPLPRDVGAQRYAYMGLAHARRGHASLAIENWRLAARVLPSHTLVQNNLATGVLAQIHEALAHNDIAIAQKLAADVANPTLQIALSSLHYSAALTEAHQNNWGVAAQQLKRVEQSLQDAKVTERRPIVHNLALLSEMAEDWSGAAEAWREVLRVLPRGKRSGPTDSMSNDPRKWIRRRAIDCYKRADQLDEAIKILRQSVKQTPDDVDTHLDLVRALYANEQEQAAEKEAQRLLGKDPNHLDTLLQVAEMQMESRKYYPAEENLEHALNVAPNDRRARTGLSKALHRHAHLEEQSGQISRAIALFERAMQYTPEDTGLLLCASKAYARNNQTVKSHDLLKQLLTIDKGKPDTYFNVALAWLDEENMAEVEAVIRQAEVDGALEARLLGMLGMEILDRVYPEPPTDILSSFISKKYGALDLLSDFPWLSRPKEPTRPELRDYGHALLHRAMQHPGATPQSLTSAFVPLLSICSHEVLPYCQWMADHMPNDAMSMIILGCAQAMQKQFKEAEASFDRARILAKAAKDATTEAMARDFRRSLRDPEFPDTIRLMFGSAGHGSDYDLDLDDFEL